uniref:Aminopeptidase n=2 Tax=Clytia hemisphaerica TaxID=252671 RepID=A0A7M5XDN7_9CNID
MGHHRRSNGRHRGRRSVEASDKSNLDSESSLVKSESDSNTVDTKTEDELRIRRDSSSHNTGFNYKNITDSKVDDIPYNETRLPSHLIPIEYDLHFNVDLNGDNFTGETKIKLHCEIQTDKIIFHGRRLHPTNITVFSGRSIINIKRVTYIKRIEMFVVELESRLEEQSEYEVEISYTVDYGKNLAGLYKSYYEDFGIRKKMVSTHFEPTDARSAFPCLDEPFYKAVFHISVEHESNLTALSNMPVKQSSTSHDNKNLTVFEPTVKMSTYLVAFSVNEFKYVETSTPNGVKVRVYARHEDQERITYAVEAASKIIHFYGQFFNTSYPLPKLDLLAVPEFMAGAMEDWGLVSFRSAYIVFDEKLSTIEQKRQVTLVIAHELAHQWFGNLVTMKWWNDIWLNEGFANYVELLGTDHVNPQFHSLDLEIPQGWQGALSLDSMKSSHPVMQEAEKPSEIDELFDAISYNKGAALLRMVQGFMGEQLEKGVIAYLQKYRYSNAETEDLLTSWSLTSHLNISSIMNSWINRRSFPIVTVTRLNQTTFHLKQQSFLAAKNDIEQRELSGNLSVGGKNTTSVPYSNSTSAKIARNMESRMEGSGNGTLQNSSKSTDDLLATKSHGSKQHSQGNGTDDTIWSIPFTYITDEDNSEKLLWFNEKETTLEVPETTKWLKGNMQVNGYYMVNYDNQTWNEIIQQLRANMSVFSANDRAGLIHDVFKLGCEKMIESILVLDLVKYMSKEVDFIPFSMLRSRAECLSTLVQDKKLKLKYMKYIWYLQSNLIIPQMVRDRSDVSQFTAFERMQRFDTMSFGLKFNLSGEVKNETRKVFNSLVSTNSSSDDISPENRALALMYGFNPNSTDHLSYLWKLFKESPLDSDRRILMRSIPQFRSQINQTLEKSLNTSITRVQDSISLLASLVKNGFRKEVWDFFIKNYDVFHKRYGGGYQMGQLFGEVAGGFTTQDMYKTVEKFLEDHPIGAKGSRSNMLVMEKIKNNINRHSNSTSNTHVANQIKDWLDNESNKTGNKRTLTLIG